MVCSLKNRAFFSQQLNLCMGIIWHTYLLVNRSFSWRSHLQVRILLSYCAFNSTKNKWVFKSQRTIAFLFVPFLFYRAPILSFLLFQLHSLWLLLSMSFGSCLNKLSSSFVLLLSYYCSSLFKSHIFIAISERSRELICHFYFILIFYIICPFPKHHYNRGTFVKE